MKIRIEPWGAWVRSDDPPALVALDREGALTLGIDGGAAWGSARSGRSPPLEVHLAVTGRCGAGCEGCYLDARPDGPEPGRDELLGILDALALAGVFTVAFGGGEPTTRDDLDLLAEAARARGLTPVVTTSGLGLGPRKLAKLRGFAQVNVSYDGDSPSYSSVRGFDGAAEAEQAISALAAEGIPVGVNVVLTRATFPHLEATLERAAQLGAREAQLLRYKPAGRATGLDYLARRLTRTQAESLGPTLRRLSARHGDRPGLRIDCALVPFLSADPDIMARAGDLVRLGVFGCEAGRSLAAVDTSGKVAPCSFSRSTSLSFEDFSGGADDPVLSSFLSYPDAPEAPCSSCALAQACRGGCKIVAGHLGAAGPDPECPRVLEFRERP